MTAPTPDLAAIKLRLSNANGLGLDEVVARHYREDVPALLAHIEQQAAEIERLRGECHVCADHARVEALIERPSLGSAEAKAAIAIARSATYLGRAEAAEAREAALVAKVAALAEECGSSGCIHLNDLWGRLRTLLAEMGGE